MSNIIDSAVPVLRDINVETRKLLKEREDRRKEFEEKKAKLHQEATAGVKHINE